MAPLKWSSSLWYWSFGSGSSVLCTRAARILCFSQSLASAPDSSYKTVLADPVRPRNSPRIARRMSRTASASCARAKTHCLVPVPSYCKTTCTCFSLSATGARFVFLSTVSVLALFAVFLWNSAIGPCGFFGGVFGDVDCCCVWNFYCLSIFGCFSCGCVCFYFSNKERIRRFLWYFFGRCFCGVPNCFFAFLVSRFCGLKFLFAIFETFSVSVLFSNLVWFSGSTKVELSSFLETHFPFSPFPSNARFLLCLSLLILLLRFSSQKAIFHSPNCSFEISAKTNSEVRFQTRLSFGPCSPFRHFVNRPIPAFPFGCALPHFPRPADSKTSKFCGAPGSRWNFPPALLDLGGRRRRLRPSSECHFGTVSWGPLWGVRWVACPRFPVSRGGRLELLRLLLMYMLRNFRFSLKTNVFLLSSNLKEDVSPGICSFLLSSD